MVIVASAGESSARDSAAIAAGVPSRALMRQAGAAAAAEIERRFPAQLRRGVALFAGPGNNGGDAWVVAAALHARGHAVRVSEAGEARTPDARAERALIAGCVSLGDPAGNEGVVVDGLLGTGSTGAPRGAIASGVERIAAMRRTGACVVALDLPSGLDATTGDATLAVQADLTVSFGTFKRGQLIARERCGVLVVVDIGLGSFAGISDGAPHLVDARFVAAHVPPIPVSANKGTRRRVAVVGGGEGMVGAPLLAAAAAARSGVGLVRLVVHQVSVGLVQSAAFEAIAAAWPADDHEARERIGTWAHAALIGPGLGGGAPSRALVERVLGAFDGPVVIDADALNVFAGELDALAALLRGRPAVLTPHPLEFSRLAGIPLDRVLVERFEVGGELARRLGAVVLLKGVPTVLFAPNGERLVSARGAPTLAVGGSGDVLGGVLATLLAQMEEPLAAAACAAWIHGRAGEIAAATVGGARGATLDDVVAALPRAWRDFPPEPAYPVLAELPDVADGAVLSLGTR